MTVEIHQASQQPWDADLLARWRKVPVAVIADMSEGRCQIDPAIRPLRPAGQQPRLFGLAVTASTQPPDFGAVLHALGAVGAGGVLVIAANGHADNAMIGGILGGHLHRKQAAGVVCDGAIRDVVELAAMRNFSIFTRHITPRGPVGVTKGAVNGTVTCGGRRVSAGDLVIGDDDGLASLTPAEAVALIDKAEAKLATEAQWQSRLAAGQSVEAVFGLGP